MDTPRTPKPANRDRRGQGQFAAEPDTAEQDAEVFRLYRDGFTFDKIAARLHISKTTAHAGYQRVINQPRAVIADEARALERARLQAQLERCAEREQDLLRRLEKRHILVQHGRVITDDSGDYVEDDDIALKIHAQITAIERLRDSTHQRIVALDGLAIPTTQQVSQEITYTVKGLDDD